MKNQRLKIPKLLSFALAVEKPIVNKTKQTTTYKSNINKTKPKTKLKTLKTTKAKYKSNINQNHIFKPILSQ
uniref:hypothetical protein n=1 Tax=Prevotella sp. TaxID=59823 RepID=UPI0040293F04